MAVPWELPTQSFLLLILVLLSSYCMNVNMGRSENTEQATWARETVGCRRSDSRHSSSFTARSLDDGVTSNEKQSSFPCLVPRLFTDLFC